MSGQVCGAVVTGDAWIDLSNPESVEISVQSSPQRPHHLFDKPQNPSDILLVLLFTDLLLCQVSEHGVQDWDFLRFRIRFRQNWGFSWPAFDVEHSMPKSTKIQEMELIFKWKIGVQSLLVMPSRLWRFEWSYQLLILGLYFFCPTYLPVLGGRNIIRDLYLLLI